MNDWLGWQQNITLKHKDGSMVAEAIIIREMQKRPREYEAIAKQYGYSVNELQEMKQRFIADGRWNNIMMQNRR
jgi:hypothetical protein